MRARLEASGELFALKLLTSREPKARKRFLQEAKVLAGLSHPNLLRLTDLGEQNGITYLAMELVQGQDLATLVDDSGVPDWSWTARTMATVAHALHYCHQQGIIHRDLKPANVLIEEGTERPVLVDFGLVKRDPEKMRLSSLDGGSLLSKTGEVKGTPKFMAPEQAAPGKFGAVSERTDVYALGATLYYLLTGQPPFDGTAVVNILAQVIGTTAPSPREVNPGVPAPLAALCVQCLAKEQSERPESAEAFARALAAAVGLEAWLPTFPSQADTRPPEATGVPLTAQDPKALGPFELLGLLGRGGMGAVYRGHHTVLGVVRAVKVLRALGGNPKRVQRFNREIRHLARVHHPNVIAIHESGAQGEWAWYAMDLLQGDPLDEAIAEGRFELQPALQIVLGVARGIGALHRAGIVHRDLKPQNIVLRADGTPVVLDLGLAVAPELDDRLTKTGALIGTPYYMAPEQIRGKTTDTRTDVYALGLLLFEVVTGRRVVQGDTVHAIMAAALSDATPVPSQVDPSVPPGVDALCREALSQDPDGRPQDATVFAERLLKLTVTPGERRRGRGLVSVAAVLATLLLVGLGWIVAQGVEPTPGSDGESPGSDSQPEEVSALVQPALSDDQVREGEKKIRRLQKTGDPQERHDAARAWLEAYPGHPRAADVEGIAHTAGLLYPVHTTPGFTGARFFDGSRFLTWAGYTPGMKMWSVETGQQLASWDVRGFIHAVVLLPGGERFMAAGDTQDLLTVDTSTGEVVSTFKTGYWQINSMALSPDGETLAVAARMELESGFRLALLKASTGELIRELSPVRGAPREVAFSADGERLVLGGGSTVLLHKGGLNPNSGSGLWAYDVGTGEMVVDKPMQSAARVIEFVPGTKTFMVGTNGGRLIRYDLETGERLGAIVASDTGFRRDGPGLMRTALDGAVRGAVFSRDAELFYTCGGETTPTVFGEFAVWNKAGERLRRVQLPRSSVTCIDLSPDESWLLLGTNPHGVQLWRAK